MGQVIAIAVTGPDNGTVAKTATGLAAAAGYGDSTWNYALFNSYGSGVYVDDYSPNGAYVMAATGGHAHGEITGAVLFNFSTGLWEYLPHNNGGPKLPANGQYFMNSELTGAPYWEVAGTNVLGGNYWVPAPPHPYQNLAYVPRSLGGGNQGSVIYVCRGAMGHTGISGTGSVHRFDLATRLWQRVTNSVSARNPGPSGLGQYEGSCILDAPRQRVWHVPQNQFNYSTTEYFDLASNTFGQSATHPAPSSDLGNRQRIWMLNGYLFAQGSNNSLYVFDPNNASHGWRRCNVSGSMPNRQDRFVHFPLTNKLYWISQAGGATLTRLTPPSNLITGTWVVDTVALPQSLPALDTSGDPGNAAVQYGFLFYVPSIQRLAWISGGSNPVYLIYPS